MPTVFYQGHDVVISDDVFAVWKPAPQVYDLEGLENVHVEHNEIRPAVPAWLAAGVLVVAGATASWALVGGPGAYVVTAVVIAVPPVAGRALRVFTPIMWSLRATYAGAEVTLFESANMLVLNRVRRGLFRAFRANAASLQRLDRAGYGEAFRRLNQSL
ncbi:DUF6232 family protein [Dactylosporangium sp. NPDC005572]|uniref:DUF6232 family protein n=1 Tax=Dactylosporangium sp. NPDC005572 TaxID=3156889 RepID=UPI00339DD08B